MAFVNLLKTTIQDFENGGMMNEKFLKNAHLIYDAFNSYPCPLLDINNAYMLGVIFSDLAQTHTEKEDYCGQVIGNAIYCFLRVLEEGKDINDRQNAAVKLLILLNRETRFVESLVRAFRMHEGHLLFGDSDIANLDLDKTDANDPEIVSELGMYCLKLIDVTEKRYGVVFEEKKQIDAIKQSKKFQVEKPQIKVTLKKLCNMLTDFITEHVTMPEQRCLNLINYAC